MKSDEARRLDEMLRAVMEAEDRRARGLPEEPIEDFPEASEEETPIEELGGIPEEPTEDFQEASLEEALLEEPELPIDDYLEIAPEADAVETFEELAEELPSDDYSEIAPEEDAVEMFEELAEELPLDDFEGPLLEEESAGELEGMPLDDFEELPLEEETIEDLPELPEMLEELPELPEELPELSEDLPELPLDDFEELPLGEESVEEQVPEEDEMAVDPLEFLSMSEEEIDKVLGGDDAIGDAFSGNAERGELSELLEGNDDLSDIQELLQMSDDHVMVDDGGTGDDMPFGDAGEDDLLGGIPDMDEDGQTPAETEEEPAKGKGRQKKEKKKKEGKKEGGGEGKEGLGKRLAEFFFGPEDDEPEEEVVKEKRKGKGKGKGEETPEGGGEAEAGKGKGKKKKEKKQKPPKKEKEKDPAKEAKEKLKREKRAEKAKLRAEKAAKAEKERRAQKKLPKKKVFVWVLLCASIGVGIMLINNIGMAALRLTDARNAFEEKDFSTAYKLLNGREDLSEEDQLLFAQSSAVLHLQHAKEAYGNHLMMSRPVKALEDLMIGVGKYQELVQTGADDVITPDLTAEYQSILGILQEQYGLPEEGALEINALESDYEFSLRLEALVRGEGYQSAAQQAELQQTDTAGQLPELEDMLPEEEEYLNGNSN